MDSQIRFHRLLKAMTFGESLKIKSDDANSLSKAPKPRPKSKN